MTVTLSLLNTVLILISAALISALSDVFMVQA